MLCKIVVLKNFTKFTGKHFCTAVPLPPQMFAKLILLKIEAKKEMVKNYKLRENCQKFITNVNINDVTSECNV